MFVPGRLVLEALANGCRTGLEFYDSKDRDMMIKRSADRGLEVTDLVVCGVYREEDTYDLRRAEYRAPHFKGEEGLETQRSCPPVIAPSGIFRGYSSKS